MKEDKIWRGCPCLLDGKLSEQQVYDLLFIPMLEQLWKDYKSQKIPITGVRLTMSYSVEKYP